MSVSPKCPHCDSTGQPMSVTQEYGVTTVLVLYCASCGAILGAVDYSPTYSGSGVHPGTPPSGL